MSDDLQLRVDKLEELCAHQSAEIDTLSDTMREQWTRIEELTKALGRFRDQLTEVSDGGGGHENTRPPHY